LWHQWLFYFYLIIVIKKYLHYIQGHKKDRCFGSNRNLEFQDQCLDKPHISQNLSVEQFKTYVLKPFWGFRLHRTIVCFRINNKNEVLSSSSENLKSSR